MKSGGHEWELVKVENLGRGGKVAKCSKSVSGAILVRGSEFWSRGRGHKSVTRWGSTNFHFWSESGKVTFGAG